MLFAFDEQPAQRWVENNESDKNNIIFTISMEINGLAIYKVILE